MGLVGEGFDELLEQLVAALRPGDELGTMAIDFGLPAVQIFAFDSCKEEAQPSIAKSHGGRVFAQSEGEGQGATFTLELPRRAS